MLTESPARKPRARAGIQCFNPLALSLKAIRGLAFHAQDPDTDRDMLRIRWKYFHRDGRSVEVDEVGPTQAQKCALVVL